MTAHTMETARTGRDRTEDTIAKLQAVGADVWVANELSGKLLMRDGDWLCGT